MIRTGPAGRNRCGMRRPSPFPPGLCARACELRRRGDVSVPNQGPSETTVAPPAPAAAPSIAALGDSITAGSPLWDPDPAVRAQLGSALDQHSQYEYWAAREQTRRSSSTTAASSASAPTRSRAGSSLRATPGRRRRADRAGRDQRHRPGRPVDDAADEPAGDGRGRPRRRPRVAIADVLPWNNGHPAADSRSRSSTRDRRDREAGRRAATPVPRHARGPAPPPAR